MLLKYIFLFILILTIHSKECGDIDIEGCDICGTGANANKCSKCSNKYFSVFEGEKCLKCDDSLLAMAGCGGNCELLDKSERNVHCEENSCKDGYYEIVPGTCAVCSFLSDYCTKCSFLKEEGNDEKVFKCLECEDKYYPLPNGNCKYCELSGCLKCLNETHCETCRNSYALFPNGTCIYYDYNCKKPIFSKEKNKIICSECDDGYPLYPNGTCGNRIYSCLNSIYSEEKDIVICEKCEEGYYLSSDSKSCKSCSSYSRYCNKCHRDNTNDIICEGVSNNEYYIYNSGKYIQKCISKISNCIKCSYNEEGQENFNEENLLCDECSTNTYLSSDRKECKNCIEENGCIKCSDGEKSYCDKCSSGYGLYKDGSCAKCSDHFGIGCQSCSLSIYDLSFYCELCSYGYTIGIDGKCKNCQNEEEVNLSNCKECQIFGKNNYECIECINQDYIIADGKCILRSDIDEEFSLCSKIVNIGTNDNKIYSCVKCQNYDYIFSVKEDGSSICIDASSLPELKYCTLSKRETLNDNTYNYTCIECHDYYNRELKYDEIFKKETCQCIDRYYESSSSSRCYTCSGFIYNCQTCHKDDNDQMICDKCLNGYAKTDSNSCRNCYIDNCEECSIGENNEVKCDKYMDPYFLNDESKVESCSEKINFCVQCSYKDITKKELKCDKCFDNFFLNSKGECQKCYVNSKIGPSCLSCTDDETLKEKEPCQKCKENYFLTKENTCVYCKSEKYGGKYCQQCGYTNFDNKEKIGCVKCSSTLYTLLENGKCFYEYEANCKAVGSFINKKNEKEYGCIACKDSYYLDDKHICNRIEIDNCLILKIEDESKLCILCETGYKLLENKCIKIIPEDDNQKIDGCSYYNFKNSIYYCIICNYNYYLNNGYCFKKPNSPLLSHCNGYTIKNNLIQCNECSLSDYEQKINNIIVCPHCSSLENIGTVFNPKYSCKKCYSGIKMAYENGIIQCDKTLIYRCLEGKINTNYYSNIYTCSKCESLYILSYSSYEEKNICKYIYEDERPKVNISIFNDDKGIALTNGKCPSKYFTRNGKSCIKCDDNIYGMVGCGGNCDFNKDREIQLKCESNQCKDGYFETLPGQCKLCSSALSYCSKCSYIDIDNNEVISLSPQRKRKLICNECNEGYIFENGVCKTCSEKISGCSECLIENDKIKCNQVFTGYYFDIEGNIQTCQENCRKCVLENQEIKCLEPSYGYFLNEEGKIISCSDDKEGLVGCSSCEYDNKNLQCNYCSSGYKLINNECKNIKKFYNLENCKNYETIYNESDYFYQCYRCEEDYNLDMATKKCIKSIEETALCNGVYLLKINNKTIYNCTSCKGGTLIQSNDGYYKCYSYELTSEINYCNLIINIGTFDEPIFSCEKCDYIHLLAMNEYGIQECLYYYLFTSNCEKGTVKEVYLKPEYSNKYSLKKEYNCTKCKSKYNLEYDNITENFICKPMECIIRFCKKCAENDVYTCEECLEGFTLNRLGFCYIKPLRPPTITFKDIFRFALNDKFSLNGNNIFKYVYRLRGISADNISDKHSFIIKTMFSSKNGLRVLDDNPKSLDTSCQFIEKMDNDGSNLKYVDYECSFDSINEDLSNNKMSSIKEDDEENENMNAFNLEELVNNVENIERQESTFNIDELNKYISFTVNEGSKEIHAINNNNYTFVINGTTDKAISNKIIGTLGFTNSIQNINCEVDLKDKDNASLNCRTDMSKIIKELGVGKYSFKTQEIIGDNNNIFFNGLNEVKISTLDSQSEKKSKNNIGLIVGLVVAGLVIIGGGIVLFIFIRIKKNKNRITEIANNNDNNKNDNNVVISYQNKTENNEEGTNRNINKN